MNHSFRITPVVLGLLASGCLLPAMAATVAGPYFQDFEGYAANATVTDFTENNEAGYVVIDDGGNNVYRGKVASAGSIAAGVNVAGASGQNFTMTTQVKLDELTTGTSATFLNLALAAAGASSGFGSGEYRFVFDFLDGDIEILRNGTSQAFTTSSGGASLSRAIDTNYTMSMSGVYSTPTSLLLTMTLTDGTDTFTGTFQDDAARTGEHFGYRIGRNGTGSVIGVYLDDFNLNVVPEPSSVLLLAGGMGLFVARRLRR